MRSRSSGILLAESQRFLVKPLASHVGRFGQIWVEVAQAVESFHDEVASLFDALSPFLGVFDAL